PHEQRTGTLPFPGKTFNDLRQQHTTQEPDLNPLPATERSVVARALAKNPQMRFATCTDFIRALASGSVLLPAAPTPKPGEAAADAEPAGPPAPGAARLPARRRGDAGRAGQGAFAAAPGAEPPQHRVPRGAAAARRLRPPGAGRELRHRHGRAVERPLLGAGDLRKA